MKLVKCVLLTLPWCLAVGAGAAEVPQVTAADYARAERFLWWNMDRYVANVDIQHHWIGATDRLWYRRVTGPGANEFVVVDATTAGRKPAFDHSAVADALSRIANSKVVGTSLPFSSFRYTDDETGFRFVWRNAIWECRVTGAACVSTQGLDASELVSPDGRWSVATAGANLRLKSFPAGSTQPLTSDGVEDFGYARAPAYSGRVTETRLGQRRPPIGLWSPDSRYLLTHRLDERGIASLPLVQSVPARDAARPTLYTFPYAVPGDERVPLQDLVVFDVTEGRRLSIKPTTLPASVLTLIEKGDAWWGEDGRCVYFLDRGRYSRVVKLVRLDVVDTSTRIVLEEAGDHAVQMNSGNALAEPLVRTLRDGSVIWYSQRDGWGHLYLYDKRGGLRTQLTKGPWAVQAIDHVDEERGMVYFLASGREDASRPYDQHLYSIRLDGSELRLLTPEAGDHEWPHRIRRVAQGDPMASAQELARFSSSRRFFMDSYSSPDKPPRLVLRSRTGKVVAELETGDMSRLAAGGYTAVEPFKVLAADGKTEIHGNLYRPSNFDPSRRYPVIDSVYPGPATRRTGTRFTSALFGWLEAQSLAELGFVVVTVDGRGTPNRSREILEYSLGRLDRGAGLEDHVAALKQLGARYPYLDLTRVGIDGASGGGFAAALGMLEFPDFYKVGVAAEGNHDQRLYAANWGETYIGSIRERDYALSATPWRAGRLQGKLLLMHGELDDNVPPAQTLLLVNALIEANKDFDFLILPNADHTAFAKSGYFIRRKWDFFVRHLLGAQPPSGYSIASP